MSMLAHGIPGGDNRYQITIRATEGEGTTNRALSTESHYTVQVMVPMRAVSHDELAPARSRYPHYGHLSDPDGLADTVGEFKVLKADVEWEWFISKVTSPDKDDPNTGPPFTAGSDNGEYPTMNTRGLITLLSRGRLG